LKIPFIILEGRKCLSLFLFFSAAVFSQSRILSFYQVSYLEENPQIDGYLRENCWQRCPRAGDFYKYWETNPVRGELKTEFMMFYNERGLYFASVNYDDYLEKIKATRTMRDDPELWTDDCNEIYFDPEGKGVGYLGFVVNFLGAKMDVRQIDTANRDLSWNLENWEYKTSKGDGYWVVESFFPWSEIFRKPKEGQLWMFDLVRYSFSTGKFRGVSWSCGGSNATPGKFGYLFFSRGKEISLDRIGEILAREVSPVWELPCPEGFLICQDKGKYRFLRSEEIITAEKRKAEALLRQIEGLSSRLKNEAAAKELERLKAEFSEKIKGPVGAGQVKEIRELGEKLSALYWDLKIEEVLK